MVYTSRWVSFSEHSVRRKFSLYVICIALFHLGLCCLWNCEEFCFVLPCYARFDPLVWIIMIIGF